MRLSSLTAPLLALALLAAAAACSNLVGSGAITLTPTGGIFVTPSP
ncbi:MAG TPA: hypothetical protein VME66_04590 [Candidatus Acidoferrales bacterium]|nr:hypothetical protein [Candidatus Acidoferrales bacterium]